MNILSIRKCTAIGVISHPAFPALRQEYAAESAVAGLPDPQEKLELYQAMEASGALQIFGAFVQGGEDGDGEGLVGFVAVLAPVLPHYGVTVAVTESLFVAAAHRKTGAGLALLRRAEQHARELGCPALLVSAPCKDGQAGRLATLLPRLQYVETNRVFMKTFCGKRGPLAAIPAAPAEAQGSAIPAAPAEVRCSALPAMSAAAVEDVRRLEEAALHIPQVAIETTHALHAGLYARTITMPAGVVLTGAEIKIPTLLIISGDVLVYGDEGPVRFAGYHVTLGAAGRKQAFCALKDTQLTMLFSTTATTVAAAEREFTDEYEKLLTHRGA